MRPALTNALTNAIRSALSYTANEAADAEQWVAQPDGATQSWVLSGPIVIPENTDFRVTFTIQGVSSNNNIEGVLSGSDFYFRLLDDASADFFQKYAQVNIAGAGFGALRLSGINPRDGKFNKLSLIRANGSIFTQINDGEVNKERDSITGAFTIEDICKFSSSYFDGAIYGFEVEINGVLTNQIPLTNKAQGATQLATVGNVNAFMPNYTDAVWRKP